MKYKFQVRVKAQSAPSKYFRIEYTIPVFFGLFNSWQVLQRWHWAPDMPSYSGICWTPCLEEFNNAVTLAKTFKSLDDIDAYDDEQNKIKEKSELLFQQYLEKIRPVNELKIL